MRNLGSLGYPFHCMSKIRRLSVFPMIIKNEWMFRISVSDHSNIMVFAMNMRDPSLFMVRYFQEEELAVAFIDEAAEGKHIDPI